MSGLVDDIAFKLCSFHPSEFGQSESNRPGEPVSTENG